MLVLTAALALVWTDMPDKGGRIQVPPPLHPDEIRILRDDPGTGIETDDSGRRLLRRDARGNVLWKTDLDGELGSREPHLLHDGKRLYVGHSAGLAALDRQTGKFAWKLVRGDCGDLHLSQGMLLALEYDRGGAENRWLAGVDAATGNPLFKAALPAKDFSPLPIREVAGLFLVQAPGGIRVKPDALLFDRKGKLQRRAEQEARRAEQAERRASDADGRAARLADLSRKVRLGTASAEELQELDRLAP